MKREIKKVDVGSVALVYGALLAALGILFGLILLLVSSLGGGMMGNHGGMMGDQGGMSGLFGGGVAFALALPIIYGILGLIIGAVMGAAYNLVAPLVGGVKVYVDEAH